MQNNHICLQGDDGIELTNLARSCDNCCVLHFLSKTYLGLVRSFNVSERSLLCSQRMHLFNNNNKKNRKKIIKNVKYSHIIVK